MYVCVCICVCMRAIKEKGGKQERVENMEAKSLPNSRTLTTTCINSLYLFRRQCRRYMRSPRQHRKLLLSSHDCSYISTGKDGSTHSDHDHCTCHDILLPMNNKHKCSSHNDI